ARMGRISFWKSMGRVAGGGSGGSFGAVAARLLANEASKAKAVRAADTSTIEWRMLRQTINDVCRIRMTLPVTRAFSPCKVRLRFKNCNGETFRLLYVGR